MKFICLSGGQLLIQTVAIDTVLLVMAISIFNTIPIFAPIHFQPEYCHRNIHFDSSVAFNAGAHMRNLPSSRVKFSIALGDMFRSTKSIPLYQYADNTLLLLQPDGALSLVSLDDLNSIGDEDHPLRIVLTPTPADNGVAPNGDSVSSLFLCLAFKQVQIKNPVLVCTNDTAMPAPSFLPRRPYG